MKTTARRDNPGLWEDVKEQVKAGDKGGKPGQWSARKAQLAVAVYKSAGGGYVGQKREDNSLRQWTKEEWGTGSGAKSLKSGERYLPKKARAALTDEEYARTTAKKQADMAKGKQFSSQPKEIAKKTAKFRKSGGTKAERGRVAKG